MRRLARDPHDSACGLIERPHSPHQPSAAPRVRSSQPFCLAGSPRLCGRPRDPGPLPKFDKAEIRQRSPRGLFQKTAETAAGRATGPRPYRRPVSPSRQTACVSLQTACVEVPCSTPLPTAARSRPRSRGSGRRSAPTAGRSPASGGLPQSSRPRRSGGLREPRDACRRSDPHRRPPRSHRRPPRSHRRPIRSGTRCWPSWRRKWPGSTSWSNSIGRFRPTSCWPSWVSTVTSRSTCRRCGTCRASQRRRRPRVRRPRPRVRCGRPQGRRKAFRPTRSRSAASSKT